MEPVYVAPIDEPPLAWRRLFAILGYGAWWHLVGALCGGAVR